MNIWFILSRKYPGANFLTDIKLQNDGDGVYIKEWNLSCPKPSDDDLNQWAKELEQDEKDYYSKLEFEENNRDLLAKLEEIDRQSIRALRSNDQQRLADLEKQAADIRAQFK